MPRPAGIYRLAARAAVPLVPLLWRGDRQRAAHLARLAAPEAIERWARQHRDPSRPLAWFHAPSVGEGLQARAVIDAFRTLHPGVQFVYTHFSPSAEVVARGIGADWSGYLCYDRAADVGRMLGAVAPELLVFVKLDVWPELTLDAKARGTRVALVAGTVQPESGRLRWPSRALTREAYAAIDRVGAIATEDAERLVALGCPRERVTVTGDPRIDSVLDAVDATPDGDMLPTGDVARTLVAGSTWPRDEEVIIEAFAAIRQSHPAARLIIAPHEPSPEHLAGVARLAGRRGLPEPVRLSALDPTGAPAILLVDSVGRLARLYASGMAAYVGGGFGHRGIHSVLEPAAWSRPVLIGPHDRGSRDARLLERAGGLQRLSGKGAVGELARLWRNWLHDESNWRRAGEAARGALERERGAAMRSAAVLTRLLGLTTP